MSSQTIFYCNVSKEMNGWMRQYSLYICSIYTSSQPVVTFNNFYHCECHYI